VKFGAYLEFISPDQLPAVVGHPKFSGILQNLPAYDMQQKCWPRLVSALQARIGDPSCDGALAQVLNGSLSSVSAQNLSTYLPLLQRGLALKTDTIEKFMEVIVWAFTSRASTVDEFQSACQFLVVLLGQDSVRSRVDPVHPSFFESVISAVKDSDTDDRKLFMAGKFFVNLCSLHGRPVIDAIKGLLQTSGHYANLTFLLFTIITTAEGSGTALMDAFEKVSGSWKKPQMPLKILLKLIPSNTPVPSWAVEFLKESARHVRYGAIGEEGLDFTARIIPGMSLKDAQTFLANLCPRQMELQENEWSIVAEVFRTHAEAKEELLRVFPMKSRPSLFPRQRLLLDEIYGPELSDSSGSDSD
jgi:hypothetical protein